jgi:diadenosine tetraphosphate (Ap4A) HIT family hydrolase
MELYKGKYWNVIFGEWCQEFPGYCIIENDKESLSELEPEAWIELGQIEKELEKVCTKLFGATMFNFACLMNNAYRDKEKPMVHYHFIPRYKNKLNLFKKVYKDRYFGYNMWKWSLNKFKRQKDIFTQEERNQIFEMMRKEFNLSSKKQKEV